MIFLIKEGLKTLINGVLADDSDDAGTRMSADGAAYFAYDNITAAVKLDKF